MDSNKETTLEEREVRTLITDAVRDGLKAGTGGEVRRPKHEIFSPEPYSGRVEIPYSWCKGNLPLHAKQLFNAIASGINERSKGGPSIKLLDITETERSDGAQRGDVMLERVRTKLAALDAAGRYDIKALTSTGVGTGDELVPSDLSSELQRRFYLGTAFGALFAAREINMPTQPFTLPLATSVPTYYKGTSENTKNQAASDPGTGNITLSAGKFVGQTELSYEVNEDAIIAVLPLVQERLALGAAWAYEDCLINGDTAGTMDTVDCAGVTIAGVANHHTKVFDGFRKLVKAVAGLKVDFSASDAITEDNCRSLRKALKRWGKIKADLVWVCGVAGEDQFSAIEAVKHADKWGGPGTARTGELPSFLGIPIIPSAFCREDLNASAVYDGNTTTKGSLLLVNKMGFLTGTRRQLLIETDRDIEKQMLIVVASFRKAFMPLETLSASITPAGIGYNWTA